MAKCARTPSEHPMRWLTHSTYLVLTVAVAAGWPQMFGAPMLLDRCDHPHRPYLLSHTNRRRGGGWGEYLRVYCSSRQCKSVIQDSSDCDTGGYKYNLILLLFGA